MEGRKKKPFETEPEDAEATGPPPPAAEDDELDNREIGLFRRTVPKGGYESDASLVSMLHFEEPIECENKCHKGCRCFPQKIAQTVPSLLF